jgi:hypothetical protein
VSVHLLYFAALAVPKAEKHRSTMKTFARLVSGLTLTLALASLPANAVFYNWTGGAATTDWFQDGNWNVAGYPDTSGADSPRMGIAAGITPTIWPHYNGNNSANPSGSAAGTSFLVAKVVEAWYYMESGVNRHDGLVNVGNGGGFTGHWIQTGGLFVNNTLNAGRIFAVGETSTGDFQISGGQLTVGEFRFSTSATGFGNGLISGNGVVQTGGARIGDYNTATLTIQGAGRLQLTANLQMGTTGNGGIGYLNLLGGTVSGTDLSFNSTGSRVRLDGGTLILTGDERANALNWIAGGNLVTTLPGGTISYAFDSGLNQTTFMATVVPEPASLGLVLCGAMVFMASRRRSTAKQGT